MSELIIETFGKAFQFVVTTDDVAFRMPTPQYLWDDTTPAVYDYWVDWGTGEPAEHITSWNQAEATHSYFGYTGDFTVSITGQMDCFRFGDYSPSSDAAMVTDFLQWADVGILEFYEMWMYCENMSYSAIDAPVFGSATELDDMFNEAGSTSGDADSGDFSKWDVSTIVSFSGMADHCGWDFPGVGVWNVSSGESFTNMFYVANNFNQDISAWIPTKATSLTNLLRGNSMTWSDENYDLMLAAWSLLTFDNSGFTWYTIAQYTEAAARAVLAGAPNNWTFFDGGPA